MSRLPLPSILLAAYLVLAGACGGVIDDSPDRDTRTENTTQSTNQNEDAEVGNLCAAIDCGAHGTCSGGQCACIDNYTGARCETPPDTETNNNPPGQHECLWNGYQCEDERNLLECRVGDDGYLDIVDNTECENYCYAGNCVQCHLYWHCPLVKQQCDFSMRMCIASPSWTDVSAMVNDTLVIEPGHCSTCQGVLAFLNDGRESILIDMWTLRPTGDENINRSTRWQWSMVEPEVGRTYQLGDSFHWSITEATTNGDLPARLRGTYKAVNGTITITELSAEHGGHIAGDIQAEMLGGNDNPQIGATMVGSFVARFPE